MIAENACGPWAALVSGHGGAPMLWWFEWQDQGNQFAPYRALSRFLVGEDPRGGVSRVLGFTTTAAANWWGRSWVAGGRALGYALDQRWGTTGKRARALEPLGISVPAGLPQGEFEVEWWDPDRGTVLASGPVDRRGNQLLSPPISGHVAFKVRPRLGH